MLNFLRGFVDLRVDVSLLLFLFFVFYASHSFDYQISVLLRCGNAGLKSSDGIDDVRDFLGSGGNFAFDAFCALLLRCSDGMITAHHTCIAVQGALLAALPTLKETKEKMKVELEVWSTSV